MRRENIISFIQARFLVKFYIDIVITKCILNIRWNGYEYLAWLCYDVRISSARCWHSYNQCCASVVIVPCDISVFPLPQTWWYPGLCSATQSNQCSPVSLVSRHIRPYPLSCRLGIEPLWCENLVFKMFSSALLRLFYHWYSFEMWE